MGVRQAAGLSAAAHAEAFFFGAGAGSRFCLLREPAGAVRGNVLYVPPFAEEQNRARRAAANCAGQLVEAGFAVLQMDLHGCGDSAGDFSEASWTGWLDDLRHAANILDRRHKAPLWLWGVRAGALLACELIPRLDRAPHLLLWQPVINGAQHLKQFLRLRATREALAMNEDLPNAKAAADQPLSLLDVVSHEHAARRSRGASHALRADWVAGKAVEVAGYKVSPSIAFGLDRAVFALPRGFSSRVVWVENTRAGAERASPASESTIATLRGAGVAVVLALTQDAPFWASAEREEGTGFAAQSAAALSALP